MSEGGSVVQTVVHCVLWSVALAVPVDLSKRGPLVHVLKSGRPLGWGGAVCFVPVPGIMECVL